MGKVYFPMTDWGDRVVNQLVGFPAGKHDDAVDAAALMGLALDETMTPPLPSQVFRRKPRRGSLWAR